MNNKNIKEIIDDRFGYYISKEEFLKVNKNSDEGLDYCDSFYLDLYSNLAKVIINYFIHFSFIIFFIY